MTQDAPTPAQRRQAFQRMQLLERLSHVHAFLTRKDSLHSRLDLVGIEIALSDCKAAINLVHELIERNNELEGELRRVDPFNYLLEAPVDALPVDKQVQLISETGSRGNACLPLTETTLEVSNG